MTWFDSGQISVGKNENSFSASMDNSSLWDSNHQTSRGRCFLQGNPDGMTSVICWVGDSKKWWTSGFLTGERNSILDSRPSSHSRRKKTLGAVVSCGIKVYYSISYPQICTGKCWTSNESFKSLKPPPSGSSSSPRLCFGLVRKPHVFGETPHEVP